MSKEETKDTKKKNSKKEKKVKEPQYYVSATNMKTLNYKVYYMKPLEKALYFIIAFAIGAAVGYRFYGGIGKDEFDQPTTLTHVIDITVSCAVGLFAGKRFIPIRTSQIINSRKKKLNSQFRDMLEALNTSLGAGKNVPDSFRSVYSDLSMQYDESAFILKELEVIVNGMANNIDIEDMLEDLGKRSGNGDIESFANVFKISYRKGGNIKDTIRSTYEILSDKMEIREEIETVVTGNKNEQNIMIIMPIVLIGVIKYMSPDFAANFTTVTGIIATTIGVILFVAAYYIGKIVLDIKV